MQVAMLGTGRMGAGMARALTRAGHEVAAWNRTRDRAEPLAGDGVRVAGSVGEAVRGADVVITMLFDTDAVLGVTAELVEALGAGAVWLQCSTVGPAGIARIADAAQQAAGASGQVALVDAPVLGTVQPAEQGTLVPLVSGPADAIERARPALDAIGSKTIVAGDSLGAGSSLKLACNAWILSITAATAQSIALARAFGLDPALFLQAIEGGAADTPYAHMKGEAMIAGDTSQAAFQLDGGRKDLALIRQAAASCGVPSELLDALDTHYRRAAADGHGGEDLAAVVRGFAGPAG